MERSSANKRGNTGYIKGEVKNTGGGWRTSLFVVMVTTASTLIELRSSTSTGLCWWGGAHSSVWVEGRVGCDGECLYACNPNTWTVEAGGLDQGQLHPHIEFGVILGYIRPCLKKGAGKSQENLLGVDLTQSS